MHSPMHNYRRIHHSSFGPIWRVVACVLLFLVSMLSGMQPSAAQDPNDDPVVMSMEAAQKAADGLMSQMSVEDKIGQLFVVAFDGTDVGAQSDIANLVANYRIGGVMLIPDNLDSGENALAVDEIVSLNLRLQQWASVESLPFTAQPSVEASVTPTVTLEITATLVPEAAVSLTLTTTMVTVTPTITPSLTSAMVTPTVTPSLTISPSVEDGLILPSELVTREHYVPLFIAIAHEGDGYPYTYLTKNVTAVPSNMAIGATWKAENAQVVGQIVGRELSALGFNLLLGPSLDVLDRPSLERLGVLGTRCFGGDPYWVGLMGKAYVRGVHEGSANRMATVVKHFPGLGGSDRPVNLEVATVRRSLGELQNVELVPFFAAAQMDGEDRSHVTDAMMTAHARYGAVRTTAKPLSFDAEVMHTLMNLPQLAAWRQQGGVVVSDALGVPAVRKYSDPFLKTFNHRYIAREAFNAGNDVLLLSQFALNDSWDSHYANVIDTIEFFREQYDTDLSFQARIDESVRRILALKYRLYPNFTVAGVLPDVEQAQAVLGHGNAEVVRMAREGLTLLSPQSSDRLPAPPASDEMILTFVDDRQVQACMTCERFYLIDPLSLKQNLTRLYGPQSSGRIDPERVHAFTFTELDRFLNQPESYPELVERLEALLAESDWLLFAMLDVDLTRYPQSGALKSFLALRDDALQGKKVVVLAYNAPYYLDTTEVSKLSAYYGMYSKLPAYVDVSVSTLFQEFPPLGASPVTVQGINYNLFVQMEPNPSQVIEVRPVGRPDVESQGTPQPIEVKKGDKLQLATSVILDRNGNPVPDGTPIEFRFFYPGEKLETRQVAFTVRGVATIEFILDRAGSLEISVIGSEAILRAQVPEDEVVQFQTVVPPTPTSTSTATPTSTPTATPTSTPTPTSMPTLRPTETPVPTPIPTQPPIKRVTGRVLSVSLLAVVAVGLAVLLILISRGQDVGQALRWSLICVIGGLLSYNLYALGWLGTARSSLYVQQWGAVLVAILGSALAGGLGVAGLAGWKRVRNQGQSGTREDPE